MKMENYENKYEEAKKILHTQRLLPLANSLHKWYQSAILKNKYQLSKNIRNYENLCTILLPRNLLWSTQRWKITSQDMLFKYPLCQFPGCKNISEVVHHLNYLSLAHEKEGIDIVAICNKCHQKIHFGNFSNNQFKTLQHMSEFIGMDRSINQNIH